MRRTVIAGNWKMNMTPAETKKFITELAPMVKGLDKCDIVLCVPYVDIATAVEAAKDMGVDVTVGNILSSDNFYSPEGCNENDKWRKMGVLGIEMEAAALYMNAAYSGKNALAICTVSDHLLTGEATTAEERQNSFTEMMEVALNTAIRL